MAYQHWTLDDIPWHTFDRAKVDADLVAVIKTAALVEYNADDYTTYLCNVFRGDSKFQALARDWAVEEVQHGAVLGRWAEMVDPSWSLESAFARFRTGFQIPINSIASIRGSRAGELIARCMVETGTSSYYTAIHDKTDEPVLKAICKRIATDEFRHYGMFYIALKEYLEKDALSRFQRLKVALGRITESEDDELAYAYYAANAGDDEVYDHQKCNRAYMRIAYGFYRPKHIDKGVAMIFKACGFTPQTPAYTVVTRLAWWMIGKRAKRLAKLAA
ncbi:MAG TPA: ferritin-like domain-containing protein [Azospirillaceae bacterium]|nr:ferritin-like domain-containing protein [Azospirillaceae bacterium]